MMVRYEVRKMGKPTEVEKLMIRERRRQAYNLKLRGYQGQEIAKILSVSPATITNDLQIRKQELKEMELQTQPQEYMAEVAQEFEQIRQEAWANYRSSEKPVDRARFLTLVAKLRVDETGMRQNLGLLDKVPNKVEVDAELTVKGHVDVHISEAKLEALTAMLISEPLDMSPEDVLQMGGRSPVFIEAPPPQACLSSLGGLDENQPLQMPHKQPFEIEQEEIIDGETVNTGEFNQE
jgi:hypothetical protein